ncbi:MAG: ribonuclease HII [Arcanobacterium sp.]|nr:ribonuclease HII [Arcanobacterium sp.]
MCPPLTPTTEIELEFLQQTEAASSRIINLAGVDEVGRGALAGSVSVGIAVRTIHTSNDFPIGLRDSKQLSAKRREELVAPCRQWADATAIGHAQASEIDEIGIISALRLAATRALKQLEATGVNIDAVLLDGSHNWWGAETLFDSENLLPNVPVKTVIKGDAKCAIIACASVLAKVERDNLMSQLHLEFPEYDWGNNKGYASAKHIQALSEYGVSDYHRKSWKLPGITE